MTPLECKVEVPKAEAGSESQAAPLTVGDVFYLRCKGERPVFSEIEVKLSLPEEQQHALKILEAEFPSKSQMLLKVTSHLPGDHKLDDIQLVSGAEVVPIYPLSFVVQSVIDPQKPPEGPYPAKTPVELGVPLWFYLALIIPMLFAVIVSAVGLTKYLRKKRAIEKLKKEVPAIGPYQNLNKELRQIQRKYFFGVSEGGDDVSTEKAKSVVEELSQSFRRYLEFQFLLPLRIRKDQSYLKHLKRKLALRDPAQLAPVSKALRELKRAEEASELRMLDCQQLFQVIREASSTATRLASKNRESA